MALRVTNLNVENRDRVTTGKQTLIANKANINLKRSNLITKGPENIKPSTVRPVELVLKPQCEPKKESLPKEEVKETNDVDKLTEAFSSQMLSVEDIDEVDGNNPQFLAQYVKEIYTYLRFLEEKFPIREHYLTSNPGVSPRMRSILVDWLIQVHGRFHLLPETLYLTVALVDRYLQDTVVDKTRLQLVGVTAMWIAAKYEELMCPEIHDFVFITDNAFKAREIRNMECSILEKLNFNLGRPLPLHFLRRNSKAGYADVSQHGLAKYLMEIILTDYECCHLKPSEIAAAALCLSRKLLNAGSSDALWNPTLIHYSTYKEEDLLPIMQKMALVVVKAENGKLQAVRTKYSNIKLMKISQMPELTGDYMVELAHAAVATRGK